MSYLACSHTAPVTQTAFCVATITAGDVVASGTFDAGASAAHGEISEEMRRALYCLRPCPDAQALAEIGEALAKVCNTRPRRPPRAAVYTPYKFRRSAPRKCAAAKRIGRKKKRSKLE